MASSSSSSSAPSWRAADAQAAEARGLAKLGPLRGKLIMVTGGGGFLGRHIAELLLSAGARVRVFDMVIREEFDRRAEFMAGDLMDRETLKKAAAGCWAVVHVASPPPTSNNAELFMRVNVEGSKLVVAVCRECGVKRLVYTSSASVVFDGTDQMAYDESCPPPTASMDAYTKSKLLAEQAVLAASDKELATCALRPHGIFGPRDPHLVPALARAGAARKSKYMIGDGCNLVDFTYVGNVAYAHALACVALDPGSRIAGQAYFITNRDPVLFWDLLTAIQRYLGYPLPTVPIPVGIMMPMAKAAEAASKVIKFTPTFTKQSVTYAGKHHYYLSEKAARDFGYQPIVPMEEALRRTCEAFKSLRNPKMQDEGDDRRAVPVVKTVDGPGIIRGVGLRLLLAVLLVLACTSGAISSTLGTVVASALVFVSLRSMWTMMFGSASRPFDAEVDLRGRLAVVTGGNKGIGLATARGLLKRGATVVVACRDEGRAKEAVADLAASVPGSSGRVSFLLLDLASFASVRAFVKSFVTAHGKGSIDFLINNAGAMSPKSTTKDGLDTQVQSNYVGPFLLTTSLLDAGAVAPNGRIVNVASHAHFLGSVNFADFNFAKSYNPFLVYCSTKLLNIMFSNELHRRLANAATSESRMSSVAVHPGNSHTDFIAHFLGHTLAAMIRPLLSLSVTVTPEESADIVLFATLHPTMRTVSGQYFDKDRVGRADPITRDESVTARVWAFTEELIRKSA